MLNKKWALLIVAPLVTMAIGCQTASPETVTVKETVVAEVPVTVEVTRVVEASVEVTRVVETPVEQSVPNTPSINPMMPIEFDTIESSVTGREYAITIALPLSYMFSDADYPVIYVTDGDFYAIPLALAAGQLAFGQEVSEFIVVGVDYGNPDPMKWLELRELDMGVDGRENYLQFFEEELIPYIEATYRADPANRTLAGHSSGGNFALYGLLNGANTFSNFIASSPGNIAGLVDSVDNFAANQGGTMTKLYLSVGDLDAKG